MKRQANVGNKAKFLEAELAQTGSISDRSAQGPLRRSAALVTAAA
jgi:hypothetical protein